ncbi:MAG: PP2C family protein-serine/threonine phosphatase [Anaerolineae bacterium]
MGARERTYSLADVVGVLYATPLVVAGLIWLLAITDVSLFIDTWPVLLLLLGLLFVFEQLDFFVFVEVTPGIYADWRWSLWSVITWSGVLIFGPTALWLTTFWRTVAFLRKWWRAKAKDWRWNISRNFVIDVTSVTFNGLIALRLYQRWGGTLPLPGLELPVLLPALYAMLAWLALSVLLWTPLLALFSISEPFAWARSPWITFFRYMGLTMGWHLLVDPFAVLAAGLYAEHGIGGYLLFILTLLLAGLLAHQLSQAVERSQLRSRELEKLERLGRALLNMSPDASQLAGVLETHLCNMFPYGQIEIRCFPERTLLHTPEDWPPVSEDAWSWLHAAAEVHVFKPGTTTPWAEVLEHKAVILAPIVTQESPEPLGGIYLARYRDTHGITNLLPAVQTLAAQIASALQQAQAYKQTLALQKAEQELRVAGQIQASFLPRRLPEIPGWQLAATLHPARETSGDFYDVIPLPNGRFGLLIADVADKGTGAALYMALSRTLLRTYALQYHTRPDYVLRVANRRILMDTDTDLFVTVFYGVLDPPTGQLQYGNAGHMPPYVLRPGNPTPPQALTRTGMPLGLFEGESWEQKEITLKAGDTLLLYTDGITDAENADGDFFGRQRLLRSACAHLGASAPVFQAALFSDLHAFVGDSVQFDDITLMVLTHQPAEERSES